ncbi:MAG: hypothetical protein OEM06_05760, partial [Desulfobacteraceae bacterium]|nr:hypothetical protein [Desulfobacteraceae bacterium]
LKFLYPSLLLGEAISKIGFWFNIKEIKVLHGGVLLYAAQAIPQIDAEIGQKGHLWMETN